MKNTKTLIYGAGALGTILGALLTRAGEDVTLVSRNEAHVQALQTTGAQIRGTLEFVQPVKAILPREVTGVYHQILLMTKQNDNPAIVTVLKKHLAENGAVCCLQNGVPEASLEDVLPPHQLLGGVVTWSATLLGPGISELTSPRDSVCFTIGTPSGEETTQLAQLKAVLEKAGTVTTTRTLLDQRWSKLLINASISAVASSLGLCCGGVTEDSIVQPIGLHVMKECIDVGHAAGIHFLPVSGHDLCKELSFTSRDELEKACRKMPEMFYNIAPSKSSILQDLQKGRKTEIRALNGLVCRLGKLYGIPTPYNEKVVWLIEQIEDGKLPCNRENISFYLSLREVPNAISSQ